MLNTDLHNPSVPKKMSLASWYKNNKGINDGNDLPEQYLQDIYNSIRDNEIKMKKEHQFATDNSATEASEEWAVLIQRTKSAPSFATSIVGSHDSDMFQSIWADTTTAFGVVFETTGDEVVLRKVVEGFMSMVRTAEFHKLVEVINACYMSICLMLKI